MFIKVYTNSHSIYYLLYIPGIYAVQVNNVYCEIFNKKNKSKEIMSV